VLQEDGTGLSLYKTVQNPALVQALAHPLRAKMLSILEEEPASPKELAEHFDVPLSNVAYHINVLRKLKVIRLVKETRRRGAVEHHYKADHHLIVDDEAWSRTPGVIKERMMAAALAGLGAQVTQAAATGGFNHHNAHLTRTHVVLDEKAWDVLAERLADLLHGLDELQAESAKRLRRSDHEGERRTGVVLMLFESAPAVPDADEAQPDKPRAADRRGRRIGASSP
jgi:DNA-binding transcriptional ArsR family regulator